MKQAYEEAFPTDYASANLELWTQQEKRKRAT